MKLPKDEFEALKKHWYKRIADAGFTDIENKDFSNSSLKKVDSLTKEMKESYYNLLCKAVNDEDVIFRNEIDKHIMVRYAEGATIKTIVEELKRHGVSAEFRRTVRHTIRRYETKWNIRHWSLKQMHLKELK